MPEPACPARTIETEHNSEPSSGRIGSPFVKNLGDHAGELFSVFDTRLLCRRIRIPENLQTFINDFKAGILQVFRQDFRGFPAPPVAAECCGFLVLEFQALHFLQQCWQRS